MTKLIITPSVGIALLSALLLIAAQATDGAVCYRKYHDSKRACKGVVKATDDATACCSKHGQGHAVEVKRVEHSKNWFECVPCRTADLDDSLSRKDNRIAKSHHTGHVHHDAGGAAKDPVKDALTAAEDYQAHKVVRVEPAIPGEDGSIPLPPTERAEIDVWSPWSEWGPCSKSCNGGVHQRMRFCLKEKCVEEDFEERPCPNLKPCIVDGGWSEYKEWSACSVTCGKGTQTRDRKCDDPSALNGGLDCVGPASETRLCSLQACPVNGGFSVWSDWTACNVTCGQGYQQRHRACDNPTPSAGGLQCTGAYEEILLCTSVCPVDGGWSDWTNWTSCSVTCGQGYQARTRSCDSPAPEHGGRQCVGLQMESMPCTITPECAVDGNWSEWSRVDSCSARPCSGERGFKTRFRSCTNPRPSSGGRPCTGRTWMRERCYNNEFCTDKVNGGWCEWTNWTRCEYGFEKRARTCECPPAVNSGDSCQGKASEQKPCGGILAKTVQTSAADNSRRKGCHGGEGSGDGSSDITCDDDEPGVTPDDDDAESALAGSGDG